MISLKKLRSFSLAIFALCFMSLTTEAVAAKCPCKNQLIYRTDAIQQGESLLSKFTLDFSAAVNQIDPATQEALVLALTNNLTTPFSITYINGLVTLTATDFNSLLALVQTFSTQSTISSNLLGSITVSNYTRICKGMRSLDFQYLSYNVTTDSPTIPSILEISLGAARVVEISCDVFKIASSTLTTINSVNFAPVF